MVNAIELKKQIVKEVSDELKAAKVVAVIDLHTLPNALLHQIRKELKSDAKVLIFKTSLLKRALKIAKLDSLLPVMTGEKALLVTSLDPFKLYKKMNSNPLKVYAKAGQIAPYDLIVPAGETQLPPGPILTELKTAGIDARIQGGKVAVGKDSVVARKGDVIKDAVAKALQKLDIRPFEVKVRVPLAYEGGLVYADELLDVDEKKMMSNMVSGFFNARAVAIEIGYVTKETLELMIQRAYREAKHISKEKNILMEESENKADQSQPVDAAVSGGVSA